MSTPFTEVFGGQNIFPAQLTLLTLAMTADVTLQWPVEQAVAGASVFADIIRVASATGPLAINMPNATLAGNGQATLVDNQSASTITVEDAGGNTIGAVPSGEVWQFYLASNATANGTWRTFQFGTGTSSATAASLAGAGLVAISTLLNVEILPTLSSTTPLAIATAARAEAYVWTGGVGAWGLPSAGSAGNGWFMYVLNHGSGNLAMTSAAGDINGAASLALAPGEGAIFISDGANWYTMSGGGSSTLSFDYTTINVAGTGDYTLSGNELNRVSYSLTGVLTGARNIVVPDTVQQYWVANNTSMAFDLTVKTALGTGVVIPTGFSKILYCDGVNVVDASLGVDLDGGANGSLPLANLQGLYVSLRSVSTQTIANNISTDVTYDNVVSDVGGWWDAGTPADIVVPAGVSAVLVCGAVRFSRADLTETSWLFSVTVRNTTTAFTFTFTSTPVLDGAGGASVLFTQTVPPVILPVSPGDILRLSVTCDSAPDDLGCSILPAITVLAIGGGA